MTPYSNVIKRFERKIQKDISYFCYDGVTETEKVAIINRRSNNLLDDAVAELQPMISLQQNVNFLDKDDELEKFNFNLIVSEEDIISDMMIVKLFEEESIKLNKLQEYLGNDIKVFSPAEERKTFLEMYNGIVKSNSLAISNYSNRDRITGKLKTIDYSKYNDE
jgi:DNA-binding ferritin-like protein (Dps family)